MTKGSYDPKSFNMSIPKGREKKSKVPIMEVEIIFYFMVNACSDSTTYKYFHFIPKLISEYRVMNIALHVRQ